MARLLTSGGATRNRVSEGFSSGVPTFRTDITRPGSDGVSIDTSGSACGHDITSPALGRWYYARTAIHPTVYPSGGQTFYTVIDAIGGSGGVSVVGAVDILTDGTISIVAGPTSFIAPLNTWTLVEYALFIPSSGTTRTESIRINGIPYLTGATSFSNNIAFLLSQIRFRGTIHDDIAINDDTGASQNSWPGDGHVVTLMPKADSARGANWLAGAGATTNLWDAVDNTPPVGVAVASATNASQVKNAAKDTSGLYDVAVEAYDVAVASGGGGIGAADAITLIQPVAAVGPGGTVAITHGLAVASNPVISEATVAVAATAAGTFPSNWTALRGTVSHAPSVTRSARPVLRLRKGTSSTTAAMAAFIGLLVEYVPYVPGRNPARPTLVNQAVNRAAAR